MNNVVDRVPTEVLANGAVRWQQFDSAGNSLGYVYLKRADEPTEPGTPLNRVLFESIRADLEHKNYVIGTYTGNNNADRATQDITLGFTPSAVIVVKGLTSGGTGSNSYSTLAGMATTDSDFSYISTGIERALISIIQNGFRVSNYVPGGSLSARFNESGFEYKYIAFE